MRMRDLDDWPPSTFSGTRSGRGDTVPVSSQQVTIGVVQFVQDTSVTFKGTFDSDKDCICTIFVRGRTTANKVAGVLSKHFGSNLISIGDIELPTD